LNVHVFEPELRDKRGHFYEYNRSLLLEFRRRGIGARIYCNARPDSDLVEKLGATPAFRDVSWASSIKIRPVSFFVFLLAGNFATFLGLVRKTYKKYSPGDIALLTTVTTNNLFGVALWYFLLPGRSRPSLVVLLRLPYYGRLTRSISLTPKLYRAAFRFLNRLGGERVHYLSDSSRLAGEYKVLARRDVALAPIPHLPEEIPRLRRDPRGDKVCFAYLGIARAEKGFFLLGEAIRQLEHLGRSARYRIQTMDPTDSPSVSAAREKLSGLSGVELLPGNLRTDSYYEVLSNADCVLVPYDPGDYLGRTSGIFAEAVAFGKPVITTDHTWMADQVRDLGSGIVMRKFHSDDLAHAMLEYLDNRPGHDIRAGEASRTWRRDHGARQYVDLLLNLVAAESGPERMGRGTTGANQIP